MAHRRGSRQLTEDEEVLQVLKEGALQLLLLLPGQLLGDSAAVAQAGPQPVAWGRQEATLRRQIEVPEGLGPSRDVSLPFPNRGGQPPLQVWEGTMKMQFTSGSERS